MTPARERTGPDALHAPWRLEYLESMGGTPANPSPGSGSFIRDAWLDPSRDAPNLVIARDAEGLIMLNRFPYTGGHLLVALGEPRASLLEYDPAQRGSLWRLVESAAALVEMTLRPQGINIGINQGRAAGAGVPQHLHVHLVPRWAGDVNFMEVVGQVRVIPSSLDVMAERYRASWTSLKSAGP